MSGFLGIDAKNWLIHPKKQIQEHQPLPRRMIIASQRKRILIRAATEEGKIIFPVITRGTETNGMVIGQIGVVPADTTD